MKRLLDRLLMRLAARRIRRRGNQIMREYVWSVESLMGRFDWAASLTVEEMCPSLRRKRFRARSCARLAQRLNQRIKGL